MGRFIELHKSRQSLEITEEQKKKLESYLTIEVEDAFSSRSALEALWRDLLRQYEGVPSNPVKDFPIENAPNIEITLGAIASDAIYAQATDLIYSTTPLVTVRTMGKGKEDKDSVENGKAFQRWINWVAENEANIKKAGNEAILDDVQLGTAALYVPFVEHLRKTKVAKVLHSHPVVRCMPIEDVITPGGAYSDLEELPWVGLRFWPTQTELNIRAQKNKWDISEVQKAGAKDWVRHRREALSRSIEGVEAKGNIYEILNIYAYYDIDGDGIDEDLLIFFDRTSRKVMKVIYNPFDRRPIELIVYQQRPHILYGIGVMQMIQPFQEELSNIHNYSTLNILLANARIWKARTGSVPENMRIYPNKVIEMMNPDDLQAEEMADVYTSIWQAQAQIIQLAERRVGTNELSPKPSATLGTRTPGITALSMLQQVNKRFTPAFDGMREGLAAALRQCMYRYQEKVLANDEQTIAHIHKVLGIIDGQRVVAVLQDENFDEHMTIELTASSASVNKEADRQNAMMLVGILAQYYQRTLELVTIASNPQTPPAVVEVAKKIANSAGEIIDRTIRTFDQIRDPASFIIEVEEEIDAAAAGSSQQAIMQLLAMQSGAMGQLPGMGQQMPQGEEEPEREEENVGY